MKKLFLIASISLLSLATWAQENMLSLQGGYVSLNPEASDDAPTGFRINGNYDFNRGNGKFSNGVSVGYLSVSQTSEPVLNSSIETSMTSIPVYYVPKYYIGKGKLKGFVKGALGMHFSTYEVDGKRVDDAETSDFGIYSGLGAGGMFDITEKFFVNAEYEWAYLSNSWYSDSFVNSFQFAVGMKF